MEQEAPASDWLSQAEGVGKEGMKNWIPSFEGMYCVSKSTYFAY